MNDKMANCTPLPPIEETVRDCDVFTREYRSSYFGKLTAIEFQNGVLRAIFGKSQIVAKLEVLPDWMVEGCTVEIEFRDGGAKVSPSDYDIEKAKAALTAFESLSGKAPQLMDT